MALFKPVQTTGSNLSNASVVDGQFVVATDRGEAYVDTPSGRVRIADVITGTYSSITSNLAPLLNKLYFATDTHQLLQAVSNNDTLSWVQVGEPTYLTSLMTNSNSGKYITFASDGSLVATTFPVASTSVVGGVKVDGTITSVNASNQLQISKNDLLTGTGSGSIAIGTGASANGINNVAIGPSASASAYSLPQLHNQYMPGLAIGYGAVATNGGIQIGYGTNSEISTLYVGFILTTDAGNVLKNYKLLDDSGVIPSNRLPVATTSTAGAVKIDGTSITITDGTIKAIDTLAYIKKRYNSGKYLTIDEEGEIYATSLPVYNGEVV